MFSKKVSSHSACPPRFYGLSKIHKHGVPLGPIVNNREASTYSLARYLTEQLKLWVGGCEHCVRNSAMFAKVVNSLNGHFGQF